MKLTSTLSGVAFVLLLLFGCNREYLDPDNIKAGGINPIFAIPLAEATLTIEDVLERDSNDILQIDDPNGTFLALLYSDSIRAITANEFFDLPGFTEANSISLSPVEITGFQTLGSLDVSENFNIDYDPGQGVDINSVEFKSGNLNLDLTTDFRHVGQVAVSIPALVSSSGVAYNSTLNFDGTSSVPANDASNTSLAGYTLTMGAGNQIEVQFNFQMTNSGNTTLPTDDLTLDFNLSDPEYSLIEGDFKNLDASFPSDSVLMRIFGNFDGGTFTLTNPNITFNIYNSFGIPFRFTFDDLYTSNVNTGEERQLLSQTEPTVIEVAAAETPGTIAESNREFNNENTNGAMSSVIEPTPKYVIYDIRGEGNPDSPTGNTNFITDKSRLDVVTDVLLPLEGLGVVTLVDSVAYEEFINPEQASNIQTILLRMNIDNGFPLEAEMDVYVAKFDEATNTMDTLFTLIGGKNGKEVIIAGAPVDPETFKVTQSSKQITDIELTSDPDGNEDNVDQVKLLSEGNRILISSRMYSTGFDQSEPVKIYADYAIGVRFGIKVGTALNVDDL